MSSGESAAWPSSALSVEVPAHHDFVASLRGLTRSAAALGDLAADDVEELQIAVDEAAALLLPLVDEGAASSERRLRARFEVGAGELCIAVSVRSTPGAEVDRTGLAWMMLGALDPELQVTSHDDLTTVTIRRASALHPRE